MVPIFNLAGEVAQMYGRKITPRLREGTPDHLYLPGPHRGVWNETALAVSKDVILCEALIDALTFWCAGYRNVTAIYGVNGFTEEHRAAFRKYGTKRIFIAYDRDEYAECAPDFHRLTALKPDLVPAWTMAGLCEYHLRDYDAALKSLRQTERLGFQESQELSRAARLHLALLLTKIGKYEEAVALLTALTRIDKKTPEIIVAAGIAGLRRPWIPPEVPEASRDMVFKLGDAMGAAMEFDMKAAIEKFEVAVRDYPKEPDIHFRFGAVLVQQDYDRGIREIKKTLDLDPQHIPAMVSLASIYLKRDDPPAAREYAEDVRGLRFPAIEHTYIAPAKRANLPGSPPTKKAASPAPSPS